MKGIPAGRGLHLRTGSESLTTSSGAVALMCTAEVSDLDKHLSEQLSRWRVPRAVHDPGKTMLDLAAALALGADCVADVAVLRAQPELFGPVASDPTISRLIDRAGSRPRCRGRSDPCGAGSGAGTGLGPSLTGGRRRTRVIVDIDATLVTSHSTGIGTRSWVR